MAYIINRTSSPASGIIVADGSVNATFDIQLIGKGYTNYGELIQENILHVMENFARGTAPTNPTPGQLWFNTSTSVLSVRTDGGLWLSLTDPSAASINNSHIQSGALIEISKLNTAVPAQLIIAGASGVPTYQTINGAIEVDTGGFTTLGDNSVIAAKIATGAVQTSHLAASVHINTLTTTTFTLAANSISSSELSGNSVGSIQISANSVGSSEIISGAVGTTQLAASVSFTNLDVANFSSSGPVTAQYSDLGERYESDNSIDPSAAGYVVIFGGDKEITISTEAEDPRVAGVVSCKAAFEMNVHEGNSDWPTIALQGRVPVKVTGTIKKGDMLVSSEIPGRAQSAVGIPSVGTVIGKSIQDKNDPLSGSIIAVVGRV
ncbi:MAG: hypothetical protein DRQ64_08690 [Gammaproteobacteria bacterium]|nr:MAG: hypothetical protein DRQ64_08690 [Gammaproteobacteria bacterium]